MCLGNQFYDEKVIHVRVLTNRKFIYWERHKTGRSDHRVLNECK